ncbi:MAG TPA: PepSY domain-containing protein [Candidatus Binataceae bacterium]|nr:PepSY domain-containing protein [Candidatus Binataceae bacterium]
MKLKRIGTRVLLHSAVLAVLTAGTALAFTGENLLPQAKITLAQARKVALKAYPGKIVSEELEQESGGSGLRYSFVIRHQKVKHEVGVDAKTGALLENAVEG